MKTYIALFRGINVGGHNLLPMKALTDLLESLGCQRVKTYIQSGNAVFRHAAGDTAGLSNHILAAIRQRHGFEPHIVVLELPEMEQAITSNPFPEVESEPKTLHLFFMSATPQHPDLKTLEGIRQNGERFHLGGKVFYLHAPGGIGRSRLGQRVEQALGVPVTARNWRSAYKIMEMAQQCRA